MLKLILSLLGGSAQSQSAKASGLSPVPTYVRLKFGGLRDA